MPDSNNIKKSGATFAIKVTPLRIIVYDRTSRKKSIGYLSRAYLTTVFTTVLPTLTIYTPLSTLTLLMSVPAAS